MGNTLKPLARRAAKYKKALVLLIFPEGTLFSRLTQPKSDRYAEKLNIVSSILVDMALDLT